MEVNEAAQLSTQVAVSSMASVCIVFETGELFEGSLFFLQVGKKSIDVKIAILVSPMLMRWLLILYILNG